MTRAAGHADADSTPRRRRRGRRPWRWIVPGVSTLSILGLAFLPTLLPAGLGAFRGDLIFRVRDAPGTIFVTIDDGPSPATDEILRVLARHDVSTTFFITGAHVRDPAQLTAIRQAGHALGHHLLTTRPCSQLSPADFEREFTQVASLLEAADGSRLFRPPADFGTREQIAVARSRGYQAVMGTVYPLDHWLQNRTVIRHLAGWLAIDGGIIILHDGAVRGPRTAAVLDALIPQLRKRSCSFGQLSPELAPPAL